MPVQEVRWGRRHASASSRLSVERCSVRPTVDRLRVGPSEPGGRRGPTDLAHEDETAPELGHLSAVLSECVDDPLVEVCVGIAHRDLSTRTRSATARRATSEPKAMESNSWGTPGCRWNSTGTPARLSLVA